MSEIPPGIAVITPVYGGADSEAWDQQLDVAASETVRRVVNVKAVYDGLLCLHVTGSDLNIEVTQRTERSSHPIALQLGPGESQQLRVFGAVTVEATNQSGVSDGVLNVALLIGPRAYARAGMIPPVSEITSVTCTTSPVPGSWVTIGNPPGPRNMLQVGFVDGSVDFRFVTLTGSAVINFNLPATGSANDLGNTHRLIHPPQLELQARHPGDVNTTRNVVATWWRRLE